VTEPQTGPQSENQPENLASAAVEAAPAPTQTEPPAPSPVEAAAEAPAPVATQENTAEAIKPAFVPSDALSNISFSSLNLPEELARGIADAGFERCTPIQAGTLPLALAGIDVAGQAQTGTGKTAAFLVAMFAKLLREPASPSKPASAPRAFIMAPTRELAVQIHKDAELLGQYTGLTLGLAFGGVDYEKQRRILENGVDVLIGTPGRIIDFFKQHVFELRHVQVMILDEADRMFDLGFIVDIRYLMRRLPPPEARLSMLFSATLAQRVLELAYEHMNEAQLVRIEPEKVTADRVRQVIYYPAMEEKAGLLVGLLRRNMAKRTIIFVNMKRTAEMLERGLQANGFHAEAMSGDVPQNKRLKMLGAFHDGTLPILIATDVAARGLHIPDVSHVFNYDLPNDPEDYVHRIGRTARAGAEGDAISFGCEDYVAVLPEIEAYIGFKIKVERVEPELVVPVIAPGRAPEREYAGGGRGGPRGRSGPGGGRDGGRSGGSRDGGGRGAPRGDRPRREDTPVAEAGGAEAPAGAVDASAPHTSSQGSTQAPRNDGQRGPRQDRGPRPDHRADNRGGGRGPRPEGGQRGPRPEGQPADGPGAPHAEGAANTGERTDGQKRRRRRGGRNRGRDRQRDQQPVSAKLGAKFWWIAGSVTLLAAAASFMLS
jgi:ATP-dependent RNA helicase RhlB